MKIDIICVGKIKERFYEDAIGEYIKRLSKYAKVSIVELADEKTKDNASSKEEEIIKNREGERILSKLKDDAYIFTLEINGKNLSSEKLAEEINNLGINGQSYIQFVIGGSIGLSKAVTDKANYHLSFSAMTFPHQLMRVILLEQIYRCFRIINNEPYHK